MKLTKMVSSSLAVIGCIVALSAPMSAFARPHGHQVCHFERHHHRVCHWVR